jgi:hypothetical protein
VVTDYSDVGLDSHSNVKVYVRLRPPDPASVKPATGAAVPPSTELSLDKIFERDGDASSRWVLVVLPAALL